MITIPYNKEINTYNISICSDWNCENVLTTDSTEIKLSYYEEIKEIY